MPRGAEEGERGDVVRGTRGFLIISNSRGRCRASRGLPCWVLGRERALRCRG